MRPALYFVLPKSSSRHKIRVCTSCFACPTPCWSGCTEMLSLTFMRPLTMVPQFRASHRPNQTMQVMTHREMNFDHTSLSSHAYCSPGSSVFLTANIFPVTVPANPSTCLAYCSICLEFSIMSSLLGSCGSLNSLCHSSSGNSVCFAAARAAFSDFRFCCHAAIFCCSRASERW